MIAFLIKWFFVLLYTFVAIVCVIMGIGAINGIYVELTKPKMENKQ